MKELLFDTSVYGELVDDEASLRKVAEQVNLRFMVFGSSTVRKELEETPSVTLVTRGKFKGLNLRELLLRVYRLFVEGSGGEVAATDLVEVVALRYLLEYEQRENKEDGKMLNDFRIVAAASLHWIGLFVSADKAQLSAKCAFVYRIVNRSYQLSVPVLVLYPDFSKAPETYVGLEEEA